MRVVVDTNVLVSGTFFGGAPLDVLRACREGRVVLLLSPEIIDEFREVLQRFVPDHPGTDAAVVLSGLTASAVVVEAPRLARPVCRDPKDDKFIACAFHGHADCIVSGDRHLRDLHGSVAVPILTPRQFVEKFLALRR